jgi:predicted Zn-dependent protease
MRAILVLLLSVLNAGTAWGAEIDNVLVRSHERRLQEFPQAAPDDERVAVVRASFDRLCRAMQVTVPVTLHVISGPVQAESMLGRVIAANQALGELPEGERLFVLAHEMGHVALGHWDKLGTLFRKHIPGDVVQEHTDRVAPVLGREASALMHANELEADAYALAALKRLGFDFDAAMATFLRHGVQHDTATHPGTRKRVAHLRTLM